MMLNEIASRRIFCPIVPWFGKTTLYICRKYDNNGRILYFTQGRYRESTSYLDYQQYGFDSWLREDQIYISRLFANGALLSDTTVPICQTFRTQLKAVKLNFQ